MDLSTSCVVSALSIINKENNHNSLINVFLLQLYNVQCTWIGELLNLVSFKLIAIYAGKRFNNVHYTLNQQLPQVCAYVPHISNPSPNHIKLQAS